MKRILTCLALTLCSATAAAQTVELSQTQSDYNKEGTTLVSQGKFKEALSKFQASSTIGEANITYLNIGRTLAKMGECKRAKEAYGKVTAAPKVASPTPSEIASVLEKFQSEMPEVCPARLELVCTPDGATATVNGNPMACNAGIVDIEPGDYTIVGTANGETFETAVTLAAGESEKVNVTVPVKSVAVEDPDSGVKDGTSSGGMSPLKLTGIIVGGLGIATLGTALVIDQVGLTCVTDDDPCEDISETKSLQNINRVLFVGGGVLTTAGVVLFLIPSKKETQVGFTYKNGKAGVRLRYRF